MPNTTPQGEQGVTQGIFDHIKGARAQDHPDDVESTEAAPNGGNSADQGNSTDDEIARSGEHAAPKVEESDEEPAQLRARIEELERRESELVPYAQFGMAIYNDPRGKQMAQRWQQGQQVFDGNTKGQPLTAEALQAELDRREAARAQIDDLNNMVIGRHPEFAKIRRSDAYASHLEGELVKAWRPGTKLHPDTKGWSDKVLAKNFTAMMRAYEAVLRDSPKVIEAAKEAGRKESKERAEAALAGDISSSSGTSKTTGETPPKSEEDMVIERMMRSGGVGRSFGTVGRGPK